MIECARGLSPRHLRLIEDLEQKVLAVDGGRLKLEWDELRGRRGDEVEDLLYWEGDSLLGFLGIYSFGAPVVELTGMVDPSARRRGIATALLERALPLCRQREYTEVLLVVPRACTAAHTLAAGLGAAPHHCEHAMHLLGEPAEAPAVPGLRLRPLTTQDIPVVDEVIASGFAIPGGPAPGQSDPEHERRRRSDTLVIEVDGAVVGALRLVREGNEAGIYGLVVRPDQRGRGIGRDALRRSCLLAGQDGAERVHLDVAVDNDVALGLYTSLGFTVVTTEDYYSVPF